MVAQALLLLSAGLALSATERRALPPRPSFRGGVGMMHTPLALAGRPATLRVALQSDFFQRRDLFCCTGPMSDTHRRHRTVFNVGWTPLSWLELQLALEHGVNRNDRNQLSRQDPPRVYAMGDTRVGLKLLAPWWTRVFRMGLQQEIQVLSGAQRGRGGRVRYGVDLLATGDFFAHPLRLPLRLAGSLGVLVDRSHRMYDWSGFDDPMSREVFRFGVGSHQDRLRMRAGIDAPLVWNQRWGVTPMLELQWDRSFRPEESFEMSTPGVVSSMTATQRSGMQLSASAAIRPSPKIFVDLGYQVTLLQPDFAFGPKLAPWQLSVALGGNFDLRSPRRRPVRATAKID